MSRNFVYGNKNRREVNERSSLILTLLVLNDATKRVTYDPFLDFLFFACLTRIFHKSRVPRCAKRLSKQVSEDSDSGLWLLRKRQSRCDRIGLSSGYACSL